MEEMEKEIETLEAAVERVDLVEDIELRRRFWLRLGLLYQRRGDSTRDLNRAVNCFQNYLRLNRKDYRVWESLGQVFLTRGSYLSSLKAFDMSIQMKADQEPTDQGEEALNHNYALLKMAQIQRILGRTQRSVEGYEKLLEQMPTSVPCLLGLSQTKLMAAEESFKSGLYVKGYQLCGQVLELAGKASQLRPDLCQPHNVYSNGCLMICMYGEQRNSFEGILSKKFANKSDLLKSGLKSTRRVLSLTPQSSHLWHNLGILLWLIYRNNGEEDSLRKSIKSLLKALSLRPKSTVFWNTLGVVSQSVANSDWFSQHCFLKSQSMSSSKTEKQWNNLGSICLVKGLKEKEKKENEEILSLAHFSFTECQAQDPSFINGWIGLAFLAESIRHEETLDLFRHCNVIGVHPEAQVGLARQVLQSNRRLDDSYYHQTVDCLQKFISWSPREAFGYNSLGLVYEKLVDGISALRAYQRGVEAIDKQETLFLNFLRCSALYSNVTTLDVVNIKPESKTLRWLIFRGLASFKSEHYEDSLEFYKKALKLAENEEESEYEADLLLVIGLVSRKLDASMSKTWIMKSIQIESSLVPKLLCLILNSIREKDEESLGIGLDEFWDNYTFDPNEKWLKPFALISLLLPYETEKTASSSKIKDLIRLYPHLDYLWVLEAFRLTFIERNAVHALKHLTIAATLSKSNPSPSSPAFLSLCYLLFGISSLPIEEKTGLRFIQKAVHLRPDSKQLQSIFDKCRRKELIVSHPDAKEMARFVLNSLIK